MGSQGAAGQGGSQWMSFLPLILLFVVFYFYSSDHSRKGKTAKTVYLKI